MEVSSTSTTTSKDEERRSTMDRRPPTVQVQAPCNMEAGKRSNGAMTPPSDRDTLPTGIGSCGNGGSNKVTAIALLSLICLFPGSPNMEQDTPSWQCTTVSPFQFKWYVGGVHCLQNQQTIFRCQAHSTGLTPSASCTPASSNACLPRCSHSPLNLVVLCSYSHRVGSGRVNSSPHRSVAEI